MENTGIEQLIFKLIIIGGMSALALILALFQKGIWRKLHMFFVIGLMWSALISFVLLLLLITSLLNDSWNLDWFLRTLISVCITVLLWIGVRYIITNKLDDE